MAGFVIFPKIENFVEIKNVPFSLTRKEQYNGLMNNKDPSFMVFLYKEACIPKFWMKNTPLPLDIIFFDHDSNISSIRKGKPFDETLIEANVPCKFVIEAPYGFCRKHGIDLGDRAKLKYDKSILDRIFKFWSL